MEIVCAEAQRNKQANKKKLAVRGGSFFVQCFDIRMQIDSDSGERVDVADAIVSRFRRQRAHFDFGSAARSSAARFVFSISLMIVLPRCQCHKNE